MPAFIPLSQRVWYKVNPNDETGCWEWTGAKDKRGYARVNVNQRNVTAYQVVYEICRGDVPKTLNGERVHLMHSCDNPACVHPWHLSVGTARLNSQDMIAKGRAVHPPMRPDVTKCKSGKHDWTPENIYTHQRKDRPQVDQTCRLCAKERGLRRGMWRSVVLDG